VGVDDFIITRMDWLLGRSGVPSETALKRRFFALVSFLQGQGLTRRQIVSDISDVTADSELRSTDLTDEGMALIKRAYDKWASSMDITHDYDDIGILQTELTKMRATGGDLPIVTVLRGAG
jgi:hypothetical protein